MSSDTAQLIKDKIDIVDFLRQYVELKPAGKNFKARCPFHKEKTPSFMISPERQSWHCFGSCNEGGDIIKFLMKYENIEFYDALKILAEKAGVDIKTSANRDFRSHNSLYAIMEAAKNFYKSNLEKATAVQKYLAERGLKEETIKEFEIGFAPELSDGVTRHLLKSGFAIADIEKAGLSVKTERGTYWDRFRGRVMFPIYNHFGKVVAFTGRILPDNDNPNVGKYVNSPETPIFQKSKILYGLHKTKGDIRDTKSAVLVEGQMDLLMMWQDGVKNVVATSGTALTPDHLTVLKRLADELVLSFDSDEAGQIAAERAIDFANAHDFSVKLLTIDDKELKDPADVAKRKPGLLAELVGQAKVAMDYYFHKYVRHDAGDMKSKKQKIRTVLSKIKNLPSPIDRNHWLKELAAIVKIEERILMEEMEMLSETVKSPVQDTPRLDTENKKMTRREVVAQRLLGIMFHLKSDLKLLEAHLQYLPDEHAEIYKGLLQEDGTKIQNDLKELMSAISLRFSFENQHIEADALKKEMENLLRELKVEYLKDKRQQISELIRKLEAGGSEQELKEALYQFDLISKELHNI